MLHTWTYADFLEDPLTWTLLGIGVALARARDAAPREDGARRRRRRGSGVSGGSRFSAVRGYLKRLVATGAAYQFGDIVAKGIALITIPLYTRHVSPAGYGAANSLLTAVILASIFLRVGVGEAFIRFYFDDEDVARRDRIARTATATVAWTTTLAALLAVVFAGSLSRLILGYHDPLLLDCAIVGLWAFTNLEMAYAQLRVDERARAYVFASGANVALTVIFTVALVVVAGEGARGLLLGNFGASAVVVLGLWWVLRRRFSLRVHWRDLRAMLRFGLPTVPADASVYALQVADRLYLFRGYSHAAAGNYSVALQFATVVFVMVRGFQYAWPPLAYSIESDAEASRLYSLVTTYFLLATGVVVTAVALLGRWIVRLLAAPQYFGAHAALPWLALAWTLYGLYQVMIVITGRAKVTVRNLPGRGRRAGGERRAAARARAARRPEPGDRRGGDRPVRRLRGDARWSCTCSRAGCSPSAFSGGAWRCWRRSSAASPCPASCCCRRAASPASPCARCGWRSCRCCWCSRASSPPTSAARRARCWPTAGGAWRRSAPGTATSRNTPRTR